jgi:hypothetical protein
MRRLGVAIQPKKYGVAGDKCNGRLIFFESASQKQRDGEVSPVAPCPMNRRF